MTPIESQVPKVLGKPIFCTSRTDTCTHSTRSWRAQKTQNILENIGPKKCTGQPPGIDFRDRALAGAQMLHWLSLQRTRGFLRSTGDASSRLLMRNRPPGQPTQIGCWKIKHESKIGAVSSVTRSALPEHTLASRAPTAMTDGSNPNSLK